MRGERETPESATIWRTLRNFWSDDRIETWKSAIFPSGTEVVSNLMCLCPNAHQYQGCACFALKPLELTPDMRRLKVKFVWLPRYPNSSLVDVLDCPSIPSGVGHGPKNVKMWNVETFQMLKSGDEIWLETDDPTSKPLPDWRLLDMQWVLQRLAALSGAAEPKADSIESDDDWDGSVGWQEDAAYELSDDDYSDSVTLPISPLSLLPPKYPTAAPEEETATDTAGKPSSLVTRLALMSHSLTNRRALDGRRK
jgi:hypothetical protein